MSWAKTSDERIKRRENGQLYFRDTKFKVRIHQRLHTTNMTEAKLSADAIEVIMTESKGQTPKVIKERIRELFGEKPKESNKVLIGELWEGFIKLYSEGSKPMKIKPWRPKTRSEYVNFWERSFRPFWEYKLPSEINEENWHSFIVAEHGRSKKGKDLTFSNHFKYFKKFTGYLVSKDFLIKRPKIWNPDPQPGDDDFNEDGSGIVIPDEKLIEMLSHSKEYDSFNLFVRMAMFMGMRSSEITQLQKDRISFANGLIKLKAKDVKTGSKTGKGRSIPIHSEVLEFLKIKASRSGSESLFPNKDDESRPMSTTGFRKRWDAMREAIGMPEITPHDLRHTYATKIFANPHVNPLLAAKSLGMSMQTAERVYIHFDEKHLKIVSNSFKVEIDHVGAGTGLGQSLEKKVEANV